jgi:hypothetical protein
MSRNVFPLWVALLAYGVWMLLACGTSGSHPLQSITVAPASADAQDYTGGHVPFVATGYYNSSPMTVTPLSANWAAVSEQIVNGILTFASVTSAVTIDNTGAAHCATGASGTYAIIAWDQQDPMLKVGCSSVTDFGEPGCNAVQASAQLSCP